MPFAAGLWEALIRDLPLLFPQIILIVTATVMLWPGDLFVPRGEKRRWAYVSIIALIAAGLAVATTPRGLGFSDMFEVDGITKGFQYLVLAAGVITILLSQLQLNALKEQTVEYYALLLFSVTGMLFLVGATDLISIYFSLELMALCIYILVAYFRTQDRSIEAGVKYFLLGAFSSGILLFGISLLFAAAGGVTTNLVELNDKLALVPSNSNLLVFTGVLMVMVGFCFKVAAVPFHMWSPDAYDGAPTPITAFMSMAPKAASLAAFLRVFGTGFNGVQADWMPALGFVAAASMILGNIAALKQQTMKRLLAYSSIAHVGYMLLGVMSAGSPGGAQAVWLYMFTYLLMQSGAFAIIIFLQGKGVGERIEDFRGLGRTRPLLAFAMMVVMLSLAGVPPLVGFFSKFFLFKLAIEQGHVTLTVIALLTSAVAAYYYLAVVALMYFKEPAPAAGEPRIMGTITTWVVGLSCALVLLGTCFGAKLLDWAATIV
ncbi:MAG: NADH-quinone oxidoreductase subunit N [Holophaga sp.]|nr:NADH-quinone oxidoreductase subunit N [Holophaga sp.]